MAQYIATAPDGTKYRITAPDDATPEQLQAFAQQQYAQTAEVPQQPQSNALSDAYRKAFLAGDTMKAHQVAIEARKQGVPIVPISDADIDQSVDQRFAQSVQNEPTAQKMIEGAGKSFADTGQGLGELVGAVSPQQVSESRRLAQPLMDTGAAKAGYLGGVLAQTAPFIVGAGAVPALAGLGARAGTAGLILGGVAQGAIAPYASQGERLTNTVVGGALGPAAKAVGALGRAGVRGLATPEARQLIDAGVKLTPGQTVGGTLRRIEDGLTSVPLIGDAIRGAQRRSVESFNRAAMNRALGPLGITVPSNVQAGRDAINFGVGATENAYRDALGGTATIADQQLMGNIASRFNALPARVQTKVQDVLESRVFPAIEESGGTLNGEQFKDLTSSILSDRRALARSTEPVDRRAGEALSNMLDDFKEAFARSNGPEAAAKLTSADRAYRGFLNLQDAAAHDSQGANGVFTPAQFRAAVKRGDASKGKSAFARGNAFMQDLSDTAASVLPRTVPDSGTPYRMFVGAGSLGGVGQLASLAGLGTLSHATLPGAVAMGASALPYTRLGGRVAQSVFAPQIGPVRGALSRLLDAYATRTAFPALIGAQRTELPLLAGPSIPPTQ